MSVSVNVNVSVSVSASVSVCECECECECHSECECECECECERECGCVSVSVSVSVSVNAVSRCMCECVCARARVRVRRGWSAQLPVSPERDGIETRTSANVILNISLHKYSHRYQQNSMKISTANLVMAQGLRHRHETQCRHLQGKHARLPPQSGRHGVLP